MWKHLKGNIDPGWIRTALEQGTLICATDGSYDAKRADNLCGAGWVIYCTASRQRLTGALVERSEAAGSYRGELLGMLAIRLLLLAVEEYCETHGDGSKIICDNKSALFTFRSEKDRVPSGAKHADIKRVLRTIRRRTKSTFLQEHVRAHQDTARSRTKLSLEARLNCICDDLAKDAVVHGIFNGVEEFQRLPLESAWVLIKGEKQTTDISKNLRFSIGQHNAKAYFEKKGILSADAFEQVAWDDLNRFLNRKPSMYQLWYGKQGSGYCGTGKWLQRWDPDADARCPNCGDECEVEDAHHLTRCGDPGRTRLWFQHIQELEEWMEKNCTQPSVQEMVLLYLKGRGGRLLADQISSRRGSFIHKAAAEMDAIGWKNFTEGKVPKSLRRVQHCHLLRLPTRITISSWMTGFIGKLVAMTHAQWIYRNISKHHHEHGTKHLETKAMILTEIERMLETGIQDIPQECACLLEVSPEDLYSSDMSQQQYWLQAMTAACASKANEERRQSQGIQAKTHTPYGEQEVPTVEQSELQSTHWDDAAPARRGSGTGKLRPSTKAVRKKRRSTPSAPVTRSPKPRAKNSRSRSRGSPSQEIDHNHEDARERDKLGLMYELAISENDMNRLRQLFSPHRNDNELAAKCTPAGSRARYEQVLCGNFRDLNSREWLNDEIINFMLRGYIENFADNIGCFNSFFMGNLLGMNGRGAQVRSPITTPTSKLGCGLSISGTYILTGEGRRNCCHGVIGSKVGAADIASTLHLYLSRECVGLMMFV